MSDDTEGYTPPAWCSFAAELFLVKNWRWDASETSDDEQRRRLVSRYLKTSPVSEMYVPALGKEVPLHHPTAKEIEVILKPWRPSCIRRTAYELEAGGRSELIVLRTDYSNDAHDDTLKKWFEEEEGADPFYEESDEEWRVLNNALLFESQQSDWLPNLLYLLPELGGCPNYEGSSVRRDRGLTNFDFIWDYEDPAAEAQFRAFSDTSRQPLVVADKQGLESNKPLLVFLDGFGNIVRSVRSSAENLGWEKMFHQQKKVAWVRLEACRNWTCIQGGG